VHIKDFVKVKESLSKLQFKIDECTKAKEQLQQEIQEFKNMIKDQNVLITDLTQHKIDQKD